MAAVFRPIRAYGLHCVIHYLGRWPRLLCYALSALVVYICRIDSILLCLTAAVFSTLVVGYGLLCRRGGWGEDVERNEG